MTLLLFAAAAALCVQAKLSRLELAFKKAVSRAITKTAGELEVKCLKQADRIRHLKGVHDEKQQLQQGHQAAVDDARDKKAELAKTRKRLATVQKQLVKSRKRTAEAGAERHAAREASDSLIDENRQLKAKLAQTSERAADLLSFSTVAGTKADKNKNIPLEIVELAMSLLSRNISAAACAGIFESFAAFEHHMGTREVDVREFDQKRFSEWRLDMHNIIHHLSLMKLNQATGYHLIHDGTTKEHSHMFAITAIAEIPTTEPGKVEIVHIPIDVRLLASGTAKAEADAVERALESRCVCVCMVRAYRGGGGVRVAHLVRCLPFPVVDRLGIEGEPKLKVSLAKCISIISDNASNASATSERIRLRKSELLERLKGVTAEGSTVVDCGDLDDDAIEWFIEMNKDIEELQLVVLHCVNHLVALLAGKGQRNEAEVATQHFRKLTGDNKAELQFTPAEVIYAISKLLADHGEHFSYYLNVNKGLKAFVQEYKDALAASLGEGDEGGDLESRTRRAAADLRCSLPSVKGSRAFIELNLATAILRNSSAYVAYLSHLKSQGFNETQNKLIEKAFAGIRTRVFSYALKARAFRDIMLVTPLVFFLNKLASRCDVHTLFECTTKFIDTWRTIGDDGTSMPDLEAFATSVLAKFPNWRGEYIKWFAARGKELKEVYALIMSVEAKDGTVDEHGCSWVGQVKESVAVLLTTIDDNLDPDFAGKAALKYAPVNTDDVESLFGTIDDAFRRGHGSPQACIAVGFACRANAFRSKSEAARLSKRRLKKAHATHLDHDQGGSMAMSFSQLPWEQRRKLLLAARLLRSREVIAAERKRESLEATQAARQSDKKKQQHAVARLARSLKIREFNMTGVKMVTSVSALEKAIKERTKGNSFALEWMRQQLRFRKAMCGQAYEGNLYVHKNDPKREQKRLQSTLIQLIKEECNPPVLAAAFHAPGMETRETDTAVASDFIRKYRADIDELVREFTTALTARQFKIPKAAPSAQEATPEQLALNGSVFEDDGVLWQVVDVHWNPDKGGLYADYFNVEEQAKAGRTYEWFRTRSDQGLFSEVDPYLHLTSLFLVEEWIERYTAHGDGGTTTCSTEPTPADSTEAADLGRMDEDNDAEEGHRGATGGHGGREKETGDDGDVDMGE